MIPPKKKRVIEHIIDGCMDPFIKKPPNYVIEKIKKKQDARIHKFHFFIGSSIVVFGLLLALLITIYFWNT